MDDIKALAESIEQEKVERAQGMSLYDKLMAGPRLFEEVCHWMRIGIRNEFPNADEAQVTEILRKRLALAKDNESDQ